jgi:hypothetical protein
MSQISLRRATWLDLGIGAVLATLAGCLYLATCLGRIFGNDGAMLAEWTSIPERAYLPYHNTLYLPFAWLVGALPRGGIVGAARLPSIAAIVLLAITPVTWFFAAAIEVHGLHFLIVTAAALVTLAAPWHRPVLATLLTATAFVPTYMSHQSAPTLGPGWILLVQLARRRRNPPFPLWQLFWIGVALLTALLVGHILVQWRRGLGFIVDLGEVGGSIHQWRREFVSSIVLEALLLPLALLLPVAALAWCQRRVDPWLRGASALIYVPLIGCVLWWGIAEQGGYLLGPALLLAAPIAAWWTALPRRWFLTFVAVVLPLQVWAGHTFVRGVDAEGFQLADRVAIVRQHLPPGTVLLACNDNAPSIAAWLPQVTEVNLFPTLANKLPAEQWVTGAAAAAAALAANGGLLLDRSYRLRRDFDDRLQQAIDGFDAAIRQNFAITELDHPSWPMWIVRPR